MREKAKYFLSACLTAVFILVSACLAGQGSLRGVVTGSEGNEPLAGASVVVGSSGVATDVSGTFFFRSLPAGRYSVEVSLLGYRPWKGEAVITRGDTAVLKVKLAEQWFEAEGVVITATRTENFIADIPARVNVVSAGIISTTPAQSADDYLALVPGVNINRSFGIYSHRSTVMMRGLSGKDQARVLVMIDGIPVNKSDGGSVNWNMLDPQAIDHIEVIKGPASAVHGSNAMGGAVNIITQRPSDSLSIRLKAGYGTYNTITGRAGVSGRLKPATDRGFYYGMTGFYRQSDGYITQSEFDQKANPYIVPSNLKEFSGEVKAGYDFGKDHNLETDFTVYNDRRGTGELVYQPEGNTTDHDTYQAHARYKIAKEKTSANLSLYWLREDYKRVNEYMKDDYTWYNVLSKRVDAGLLSSVTYSAGRYGRLSAGMDIKTGSVDACDEYHTSTDVIYNRGSMFSTGLFVQDEMTLMDERIKLAAGLRYDMSLFHDGAFHTETPSAETSFMDDIQDESIDNMIWQAFSPRISASYSFAADARVYASLGRGFRPSVLDDLCRSGRMKGGFKLANPDVNPEYLTSAEAGGDIIISRQIRASLSVYYSKGKDFLYYVNTGDSIDMGYGLRPIYISTNIPEVRIAGTEAEISYYPVGNITITGSYGYSHSVISEYEPLDQQDPVDLTGKHLTDVPSHIFSFACRWQNKVADLGVSTRYQGPMWVNDLNVNDDVVGSDQYPGYLTVDLRLTKAIKQFTVELGIQNLLDAEFYDSKGAVCPGRFITLDLGLTL